MSNSQAKTENKDISLDSVQSVDTQTQQELLDKYDSDAAAEKNRGDWRDRLTSWMSGILCCYVIYTCAFGAPEAMLHRAIFLAFCLPMLFLVYPMFKKDKGALPKWYDILFAIASLAVCLNMILTHRQITGGNGIATPLQMVLCAIMILLVLEAVRRTSGMTIVVIILVFLAYAYFGPYAPGPLAHPGLSLKRLASQLFLTSEGLFGTNVGTVAGMVSLFIIFASFMEKTGVGQFINDFALSITGTSAGGPAKVSVVTSALFGTISGNAVSNVITTGAFTIPLMKKTGYQPEFAGAVEAVASTAGQLMPPIMGTSAFIMADITGIPYAKICLAAIVPVWLYYVGCFVMVHLRAKKLGLRGLAKEDCPKLGHVLKTEGYLIIPFIFVVAMLMMGYTVSWVGSRAIVVCILVAAVKKESRLSLRDIWGVLTLSGKRLLSIGAICCAIGMIMCVCNLTGITQILSDIILDLAGGNLLLTCMMVAVICIIMGMGLPTASVYMLLSTVAAPALILGFDLPILVAHFFVFYYGLLANVTPPVAIPAYAAAGLANSNPAKTGWQAFRLALGGFLVPMIFIFAPDLLMIEASIATVPKVVTATLGVYMLSTCVEGWMMTRMPVWQRALAGLAAILMVIPETITDLVGIAVLVMLFMIQKGMQKNELKAT